MTDTALFPLDNGYPCIVCLTGGIHPCHIRFLSGELHSIKKKTWGIRTVSGDTVVQVDTTKRRNDTAAALQILDFYRDHSIGLFPEVVFIHLSRNGETLTATDETLIILEPARLVSVSELAETDYCKRKFLISRYSRRKVNRHMLRGMAVNACMQNVLRNPFDPDSSLPLIRRSIAENIVFLDDYGIDPDDIVDDARAHVKKLHFWGGRLEPGFNQATETFLLDTKLGLKGRIDLTLSRNGGIERVIELKSSKSWGNRTKPGHALQVAAYAMMVMQRTGQALPHPPVVLYSGNDPVRKNRNGRMITYLNVEKNVPLDKSLFRNVSEMRNRLLEAEITASMPFEQARPAKCRGCGDSGLCLDLCAVFNDEPCDSSCGRFENDAFRNMAFPSCHARAQFKVSDISNARRWINALDCERIVSARKAGNLLEEDSSVLASEGKTLHIERYEISGTTCALYCRNESEFREGDLVLVSTAAGPLNGDMTVASIISVSSNRIIVSFRDRLLFKPERIDVYDSGEPYLVNYAGIIESLRSREKNLRWTLGNDEPPEIHTTIPDHCRSIEDRILELPELFALQGPPGTGKTTMVCRLIETLLARGKRLLVATMTNHAADVIVRRLSVKISDHAMVRLGNCNAVEPELRDYTIDSLLSGKAIAERIRILEGWRSEPSVFISTSTTWLRGGFESLGKFDCAIIDEAGQLLLPSALGIAQMAPSCILVGDQSQLPAVLHAGKGEIPASTLTRSLLEIVSDRLRAHEQTADNTGMLTHQFRMNREICAAPSEIWYNGVLKPADDSVAGARLAIDPEYRTSRYRDLLDPEAPSVWWSEPGGEKNRSNEIEAGQVVILVQELKKWGVPHSEIGVLAPFRKQVSLVRRALEGSGFSSEEATAMVDTVDRFQGDERDVVIISLTSPFFDRHPFYSDNRRLNVALTRAGRKRIVIGNYPVLQGNSFLEVLRRHETTRFLTGLLE